MWLFVDESWSPDNFSPKYGVLLGILIKDEDLSKLDKFLFNVRKKYYGSEHAKKANYELKGKNLLSNQILRLVKPGKPLPKNICIVKEMLSYPIKQGVFLRIFASTVYSMNNKHPSLLSPKPRELSYPFKKMIENVSKAALEESPSHKVTLVFDQRTGAQNDIAIAINNYVGGTKIKNIGNYPYFAVSNVSPGVQFADIMAYLLSKRVQKKASSKTLIMNLYNDMKKLCWESTSGYKSYGIVSFDEKIEKDNITYTIKKIKKS